MWKFNWEYFKKLTLKNFQQIHYLFRGENIQIFLDENIVFKWDITVPYPFTCLLFFSSTQEDASMFADAEEVITLGNKIHIFTWSSNTSVPHGEILH